MPPTPELSATPELGATPEGRAKRESQAKPEPRKPLRAVPELHAIVVTGASSGIGRALAIQAARARYRVLLVARRSDRLEAIAQDIRAEGGVCETLAADVAAADTPQLIVDTALRAFGRIDVVVNNAGAGALGRLLEIDDAAIEAQWQLHVAAPLRIARAALPQLRATHGQLVFVGSGLARVPIPNYGAYAPAKAAIRAVAIQLRRELAGDGIAVTYVDPGLVATEFHAAMGTVRSNDVPAADPQSVARNILRGIARRSPSVSGVPWQTFGTMIGEWSSTLADATLIKMAPTGVTPSKTPAVTQSETGPESVTPSVTPEGSAVEAPPPVTLSVAPEGSAVEGPPPVTLSVVREANGVEGRAQEQGLAAALAPVARRMERVKLTPAFIETALVPGETLELNEVAMRWAGMPNKNERAALREVFDALAAAGYLHPTGDETWKVLRAAD